MENITYVVTTPTAVFGYIDESTPCGRAKAKQVKAILEQLAIMQKDSHLTASTKKAIFTDYVKAIREYVEREEICCDCDCKEEEEPYEEEEDWEEELTIEDMERYSIYFSESKKIDCDSYEETIEKIETLLTLGISPEVYGYDSQGYSYVLDIVEGGEGIYLELAD